MSGTACVHGGTRRDHPARPLVEPLVQSTTYAWDGLDGRPPSSYAREGNPTVAALERRLASLEGGGDAVCFSSGLAALDALIKSFPSGSRIVAGQHLYGGTTRLLNVVHDGQFALETVDTTDAGAVARAFSKPADLVIVETPSNPTLQVTDLRHLIACAKQAGAFVAVDNTFLTPLWQRPLELGADASVHSTTKYLDGHDATLGGCVVLADAHSGPGVDAEGNKAQRLRWLRTATGTNLAPFEAWLTLQGTKTLHLRTRQQWQTAHALATRLAAEPAIKRIYYPGLPEHPGHAAHVAQATGGGGIIAIDLGSLEAARRFVAGLQLWTLAENLGATESLVSSPALMTHAALSPERRKADGIDDGLVRLSVGVEDEADLWADLEQALARVVLA